MLLLLDNAFLFSINGIDLSNTVHLVVWVDIEFGFANYRCCQLIFLLVVAHILIDSLALSAHQHLHVCVEVKYFFRDDLVRIVTQMSSEIYRRLKFIEMTLTVTIAILELVNVNWPEGLWSTFHDFWACINLISILAALHFVHFQARILLAKLGTIFVFLHLLHCIRVYCFLRYQINFKFGKNKSRR